MATTNLLVMKSVYQTLMYKTLYTQEKKTYFNNSTIWCMELYGLVTEFM